MPPIKTHTRKITYGKSRQLSSPRVAPNSLTFSKKRQNFSPSPPTLLLTPDWRSLARALVLGSKAGPSQPPNVKAAIDVDPLTCAERKLAADQHRDRSSDVVGLAP